MVRALAEFALGAVIITLPQLQLPLLAGTVAFKAGNLVRKQHKRGREAPKVLANGEDGSGKVKLEWDKLSVILTDKRGFKKVIFEDVSGSADPGRWHFQHF